MNTKEAIKYARKQLNNTAHGRKDARDFYNTVICFMERVDTIFDYVEEVEKERDDLIRKLNFCIAQIDTGRKR